MAISRPVVRVVRRGRLAELILDLSTTKGRFTAESAVEFSAACASCDDGEAWVVWLRSAGRDFCIGIEGRFEEWPRVAGTDFVAALAKVRAPVVASLRGRVEAEGFELALAADLRVVEPSTRWRMSQVGEGRLPHFGATQRLPRIIGVERALRTLLLGEPISAAEAVDWGLACRRANSADRAARSLAGELLARGPIALRYAKEAVRRAADFTLDDGARFEHDLYVLLETTHDRAEGIAAFLEKRKPRFRGD